MKTLAESNGQRGILDRLGRRSVVSRAAVIAIAALLPTVSAGCAEAPPAPPGRQIVLLVTGTANEPRPMLIPVARALLADAAAEPVDDVVGGSTATVRSVDGTTHRELPLTPRRDDGTVEHGFRRSELIERNLAAVADAVTSTTTATSEVDLLDGIATAVRGTDGGVLVVIGSGLSTAGGLDIRRLGWAADPGDMARDLHQRGLLQSLAHYDVIFAGIGAVAGPQMALPKPYQDRLAAYWLAVCAESGAISCTVDDASVERLAPTGKVPQPVVDVPGVNSVTGPDGKTTTSFQDDVLGFAGDHWALSPDGIAIVEAVAARIRERHADDSDRAIVVTGYTADPDGYPRGRLVRLAQARADTVAEVLRLSGVRHVQAVGAGPAPGVSARVDGSFDESIGAQMRRVEISYQ
jgi:outer membrane protein OmpA-like peptidoglycan-associated protein